MESEANLSLLVANVIGENHNSHCRLCLKNVSDQGYVGFEDWVSLDPSSSCNYQPLSQILRSLLGPEVSGDIPGIDIVCAECVDQAVKATNLIEKYHNSTHLLHKIFTNLEKTLNINIEAPMKGQSLHLIVGENKSEPIFRENKKKKHLKKKVNIQPTCKMCNESFHSSSLLQAHNLSVHSLMTCKVCHLTFNSEIKLEEHTVKVHDKCPECNCTGSSHEDLLDHLAKIHTEVMCAECGKSFKGLNKLRAHEEKHVTKNECPKCGKTYLTKDFYDKHVKLCLEDLIDRQPYRAKMDKPYICKICGKGYSTTGGLRVHERFVHGNAKPHICEHCGKKFTAPSYLKNHLVTHTGEKKFKCDICGNCFVTKEALLYHIRRHTGERPFSCKLCSDKFVNASARAEHMKYKHTPPKLTCDLCQRKFYTASFLRTHRNRHHDPSSKLYSARVTIPPNVPGEHNLRLKLNAIDEQ